MVKKEKQNGRSQMIQEKECLECGGLDGDHDDDCDFAE
jgi:hypothetical protein